MMKFNTLDEKGTSMLRMRMDSGIGCPAAAMRLARVMLSMEQAVAYSTKTVGLMSGCPPRPRPPAGGGSKGQGAGWWANGAGEQASSCPPRHCPLVGAGAGGKAMSRSRGRMHMATCMSKHISLTLLHSLLANRGGGWGEVLIG